MKHKGCGGTVVESAEKFYEYVQDDNGVTQHAALFCTKCGEEILGDAELEEAQQ